MLRDMLNDFHRGLPFILPFAAVGLALGGFGVYCAVVGRGWEAVHNIVAGAPFLGFAWFLWDDRQRVAREREEDA